MKTLQRNKSKLLFRTKKEKPTISYKKTYAKKRKIRIGLTREIESVPANANHRRYWVVGNQIFASFKLINRDKKIINPEFKYTAFKAVDTEKIRKFEKELFSFKPTKERFNFLEENIFAPTIANHLWHWVDDDQEFAYVKLIRIDEKLVDTEIKRKFNKTFLYSKQIKEGDFFQIIMKDFSNTISSEFKRQPRKNTELFDEEIKLLNQTVNEKKD